MFRLYWGKALWAKSHAFTHLIFPWSSPRSSIPPQEEHLGWVDLYHSQVSRCSLAPQSRQMPTRLRKFAFFLATLHLLNTMRAYGPNPVRSTTATATPDRKSVE